MAALLRVAAALFFIGEVLSLVAAGSLLGVGWTLLLLLVDVALGALLIRAQGLATLRRWRRAAAAGEPPFQGAGAALALIAAGILLIVPGFLSDIVAVGLALPPVRRLMQNTLTRGVGVRRSEVVVIEGTYSETAGRDAGDLTSPRRDGRRQ